MRILKRHKHKGISFVSNYLCKEASSLIICDNGDATATVSMCLRDNNPRKTNSKHCWIDLHDITVLQGRQDIKWLCCEQCSMPTKRDSRRRTYLYPVMINFIHQAVDKYNETNTGK